MDIFTGHIDSGCVERQNKGPVSGDGKAVGVCSRRTSLTSRSSEDVVILQLCITPSPMQEAIPVHREGPQETQEA